MKDEKSLSDEIKLYKYRLKTCFKPINEEAKGFADGFIKGLEHALDIQKQAVKRLKDEIKNLTFGHENVHLKVRVYDKIDKIMGDDLI